MDDCKHHHAGLDDAKALKIGLSVEVIVKGVKM
jgi:hypothetical protein